MRVGDAVGEHHEHILAPALRKLEDVVHGGIGKIGDFRRHALVVGSARQPLESLPFEIFDGHFVLLRRAENLADCAAALALEKVKLFNRLARAERLSHGIAPVNQHLSSSAVITRNSVSLSVCPVR